MSAESRVAVDLLNRLRDIAAYPDGLLLNGSPTQDTNIQEAVEQVLWQQAELALICSMIIERMDFGSVSRPVTNPIPRTGQSCSHLAS